MASQDLNKLLSPTQNLAQYGATPSPIPSAAPATPVAINSATLTSQPDFHIPEPTPSVAATGELARHEATTDQYTKDLEAAKTQSATDESSSFSAYMDAQLKAPTASQLQSDSYAQKGGVNDIKVELNSLNSQMRAEQYALRKKVEAIQKNGGGLQMGAAAEIRNAENDSLSKQADLAVIQLSAQGRYDSARDVADRAINARMDSEQKRIDLLGKVYDRNKSLFDKSEQRLFEEKQAGRQRDFETEKDRLKQISDLSLDALQNGAPPALAAKMREAQTVEEAMRYGGQYIGLLERQKASASISAANLSRRKDLLALALAGDPEAVKELGYDPANLPMTTDELRANEDEYAKAREDVARVDGLLANDRGLQAVSGTIRSPMLSGFFSGGKAEGIGTLTRFTPGIGNVQGAIQSANDANDFLSDASYVINNMSLDKIAAAKKEGVSFGALSDSELEIIGSSASELAAMAVRKDGVVIGFRGSEGKVREELRQIKLNMQKGVDRANAKMLKKSERDEIANLANGN